MLFHTLTVWKVFVGGADMLCLAYWRCSLAVILPRVCICTFYKFDFYLELFLDNSLLTEFEIMKRRRKLKCNFEQLKQKTAFHPITDLTFIIHLFKLSYS